MTAAPRWPADAPLTAEDRRLIVEVLRWGRANGWRSCGNWDTPYWSRKGVYRIFADRYDDGVLHLRIDDKVANQGLIDIWPRSVREAVDVLVALGILPVTLSSAYRAGVESVESAVHACAEFGEGSHAFFRMDETMPVLQDALTYWSSMAGSSDVQQAVGIKLDGLLDREPFARRGQVETIVEAVMGALERAS